MHKKKNITFSFLIGHLLIQSLISPSHTGWAAVDVTMRRSILLFAAMSIVCAAFSGFFGWMIVKEIMHPDSDILIHYMTLCFGSSFVILGLIGSLYYGFLACCYGFENVHFRNTETETPSQVIVAVTSNKIVPTLPDHILWWN